HRVPVTTASVGIQPSINKAYSTFFMEVSIWSTVLRVSKSRRLELCERDYILRQCSMPSKLCTLSAIITPEDCKFTTTRYYGHLTRGVLTSNRLKTTRNPHER